ncbi:MAG: phosphoserine phosphatase SerB [Campylobacteraceae bacterium]|jgi:phosphoserine phosphatase|nr:phosphoserine phosphatase SerB [Campylobacteraceae bacterium]
MIKLGAFDFDSTLMDGETIDILANSYGVGEEVSKITKLAMAGELDFFESLQKRASLLKGMDEDKLIEISQNLTYMCGAKELISKLKEKNVKVVVFSGGFRTATSYAKNILGFDADFANVLHVKNKKLTGLVGGDMMFGFSKGDMLKRLQQLLNISKDETMSVGDGANDISMFEHSSIKVAFCAKEILRKNANVVIDEKDLTKILFKVDI